MTPDNAWTTLKVINWTKEYLLAKGVANARLEAEWLLCAATGLDRVGLYLNHDKPLNEHELAGYRAMVSRRARREPLQHILGSQEFYGSDFEVSHDVLIPRHDTEILVLEALKRHRLARTVLDIGTGSGCIAITLQKHLLQAEVTATDISEKALSVARRNALKHSSEVEFLHGSLFIPVAGRRFDLIVSNPPYIPSSDIESLDDEVRFYDPLNALDGGSDGLDFYRAIISASPEYLNHEGWLLLEIGVGQALSVQQLFRQTDGYGEPITVVDLSGIERVVVVQWRNSHEYSGS